MGMWKELTLQIRVLIVRQGASLLGFSFAAMGMTKSMTIYVINPLTFSSPEDSD